MTAFNYPTSSPCIAAGVLTLSLALRELLLHRCALQSCAAARGGASHRPVSREAHGLVQMQRECLGAFESLQTLYLVSETARHQRHRMLGVPYTMQQGVCSLDWT